MHKTTRITCHLSQHKPIPHRSHQRCLELARSLAILGITAAGRPRRPWCETIHFPSFGKRCGPQLQKDRLRRETRIRNHAHRRLYMPPTFHKNGRMDAPSFSVPAQPPLETSSNSGVSQPAGVSLDAGATPTLYTVAAIFDTPNGHESQPVGKNEAHAACTRLLAAYPQAGGVDVTDGIAFPWQRFLRSQAGTREIVGPGVCRVCMVLRANKPSLAFHRTDGFIYVVTPSNMRTVPPYEVIHPDEAAQWSPAYRADVPWLRMV